MKNVILKYYNYIKENLYDTPENYVFFALKKIKKKIDKMFDYETYGTLKRNKDINRKLSSYKKTNKNDDKITLKELGIELISSEISNYSKLYDNLNIKFKDDNYLYNLIITIDLNNAMPKNKNSDFSIDDIKKCFIKFKKYDLFNNDIIGQITKNIEIKDINEELLIKLKIELDDMYNEDE